MNSNRDIFGVLQEGNGHFVNQHIGIVVPLYHDQQQFFQFDLYKGPN